MYLTAANISDNNCKLALLLYIGGIDLRKINKTLIKQETDIYHTTIKLLNEHFNIEKKLIIKDTNFNYINKGEMKALLIIFLY
jgi:hypothetical protein